ncbi:MAG: thymidylate synthase [Candidatus Paceibacterota bacterium]|jgi:thymidylate synthase
MHTIITDNIADAHEAVVKLIMTGDYNDIVTEDGESIFEYPEPVNIHINKPNIPPFSSPAFKFGAKALEMYARQVMTPRPFVDKEGKPDFSYLYSNLIFDYPEGTPFKVYDKNNKLIRIDWPYGNGKGDGTDQIEYVVRKLTETPTTRRAVVSLFEPAGFEMAEDPPCLNHLLFFIRNNKLNMHALFRSNDMLSAWGSNAYALMILQKMVVDKLGGVEFGWMEITSLSAHIYFKRDQSQINEFKKLWH